MIVDNPKNKSQLIRYVQSLRNPKLVVLDVLSKDQKNTVVKEFDLMISKGAFSIIFIRDQ